MLRELIRALFMAGLPVALASYGLVWWAMRQGHITPVSSVRAMEKGMKLQSKKRRQDRKQRKAARKKGLEAPDIEAEGASLPGGDPVHKKWLAFGGGFYGVVGVLTYVVVELGELRDFFRSFESLSALLAQIGFDMLINLFVEAMKNFAIAIAWPVYWMSEIRMNEVWIWVGVAYLGYWAGVKAALQRFGRAAS